MPVEAEAVVLDDRLDEAAEPGEGRAVAGDGLVPGADLGEVGLAEHGANGRDGAEGGVDVPLGEGGGLLLEEDEEALGGEDELGEGGLGEALTENVVGLGEVKVG